MQLTSMPIWLFTGLAVLTAGVLAALQYLRIRPRQVSVITTLFWQQAADQAQARTLFERFRHPRTYLLLLAASLLLLLALATPILNTADQPHRVIALESGLAMTAPDQRFENALKLVRAESESVDENRVAVITADPHPRLLKHFDESLATLQQRLKKIKIANTPVLRSELLHSARSLLEGRENGEVVLVSAQPTTTDDDKIRLLAAGEVLENAFILSASFVPNAIDLTRGDFVVRVGVTGNRTGSPNLQRKFQFSQGDKILSEESLEMNLGDVQEFKASGIAADGSRLTATVMGDDSITADNKLEFQLPDRRRILVVPSQKFELPPVLVSVLGSLPEVTTVTEMPIEMPIANGDSNLPVIQIGPRGSGAQVLILPGASGGGTTNNGGELLPARLSEHPLLAGIQFEDALCRAPATSLNDSDHDQPLLFAGSSPVASLSAGGRQLIVSDTLFDDDATLVRRTGYMVFWSTLLHHLAGWSDEPMALSPVAAGRWTDAAAGNLTLLADENNFNFVSDAEAAIPSESERFRWPVWQWLLFAALGLMSLDGVLNIRGKIS